MFFLCSCWQAKPGKRDILSINNMKLVMWDMIQADEFAPVYIAKDSTRNLKKETKLLYQKVFALHKIDSARFYKSFDYYKAHPEDYKILLDSLSAFANRERDNRFYMNRVDRPVKPQ
jgi:hypothetical protein